MNTLIKQFAEQAHIEFTYDPTETPMRAFAECWETELEKFVELIVCECAEVAACNAHVSGFSLGDLLKQHFGVEA